MRVKKIIGISLLIIGILLLLAPQYIPIEYKQVESSCYDQHNNEIIGYTCLVNYSSTPMFISTAGLLLFFLGAIILITMGDNKK